MQSKVEKKKSTSKHLRVRENWDAVYYVLNIWNENIFGMVCAGARASEKFCDFLEKTLT